MKNTAKYVLGGLGFIVVAIGLVVAYIAATFNPNDYKPLIIKLVKEQKQRNLVLDGDIKLSFYPKIGADLGKISLSDRNSDQTFAAINSAKVSLALLPLLKKELVVDTVYVDGISANIVRFKDGTTNFDDLISQDKQSSEQIKFDVDGVHISNGMLGFKDEMTGGNYSIKQFNLRTGHVALQRPFDVDTQFAIEANQPAIQSKIAIKANVMADPEAKHFVANQLDATIMGDLVTAKQSDIHLSGNVDINTALMTFVVDQLALNAKAQLNGATLTAKADIPALKVEKEAISGKQATLHFSQEKAGASTEANITLADMQGDKQSFKSGGIKADISSKNGSDTMTANIVLADMKGSMQAIQSSGVSGTIHMNQGARTVEGQFSSPFSGNLQALIFDLPKLAGNLNMNDPALPNGKMQGTFLLKVHADIQQQQIASNFNVDVDNTKLNGSAEVLHFSKPNIKFDVSADTLDMNKLLGNKTASSHTETSAQAKPADLSFLSSLLLEGKLAINQLIYDKYKLSGLNFGIKADGTRLDINPFAVKFDETSVKGGFGISRFAKPIYHFDVDIDKLDADKYITKSDSKTPQNKADPNAPIDLSALKQINADGELRIGWLKLANVKTSNVRIKLQADDGVAQLAPFSANLYNGAMNGSLRVDARSTPMISFKQSMSNITIGPLLVDAINNDMLDGHGSLDVDMTTQGSTVGALKKAIAGTAALNLTDGAVKGIDIAGKYREIKSKINILKSQQAASEADKRQKTDFSELKASFNIKNGVAHNDDLTMKAPLFRLAGSGDLDIGNEMINYLAKPTIVKTLKGQEGADLSALDGVSIPIKVTGPFLAPKYGIDYSQIGLALAKSNLTDKIGGSNNQAVKDLLSGNKEDALKSLLGGKKKAEPTADTAAETAPAANSADANNAATEQKPETVEDKAKKKLNKLLGF